MNFKTLCLDLKYNIRQHYLWYKIPALPKEVPQVQSHFLFCCNLKIQCTLIAVHIRTFIEHHQLMHVYYYILLNIKKCTCTYNQGKNKYKHQDRKQAIYTRLLSRGLAKQQPVHRTYIQHNIGSSSRKYNNQTNITDQYQEEEQKQRNETTLARRSIKSDIKRQRS